MLSGGVAVLCDSNGLILKTLRDELLVGDLIKPGQPLITLFDTENVDKGLQFLQEIQREQAAFDWELNLKLPDRVTTLHFAGGLSHDRILVVGSSSRARLNVSFYEEIMRINNEQMNAFRSMLKEQNLQAREQGRQDRLLFDEFTQLNNELVNVQRELAKRNVDINAERERYRMISELVSDYAYSCRVDSKDHFHVEWVTEAFSHITGYTLDEIEVLGGWQNVFYPSTIPDAHRHMQVFLSGESSIAEFAITTKDGQERWLRETVHPVWDKQQRRVTLVYGAAKDITKRKLAEQQAMKLAIEQARARILADFIRDASHEFRTPLAIMMNNLYLMEHITDPGEQRPLRNRVQEQIHAIENLISALTTMAELQSRPRLELQMLAVERVVQEAVETVEQPSQAKEQTLVIELPDEPLLMCGDQEQVVRALVQILDNAVRYTPEQGAITIRGYPTESGQVAIEVQDTGVGIEAEVLPRVFDRFYRNDQAHTTKGLGLGLPIAKLIVELLGGQISITSDPGIGTTATLRLPDKCP